MIQQLSITDIRNLTSVSIKPSPSVNVFYGLNGSGKTSVLEAIHILGIARSFRTTRIKPVIHRDAEVCTVFGRLGVTSGSIPVGVSRNLRDETLQIRVAGENLKSTSELARLLPLQVINPDTFRLLEGSPKLRRNFIDWGVFHVKHKDFFPLWKRMQKALKQRNSLLRHGRINSSELTSWNIEFEKAANAIDLLRSNYIQKLIPVFNQVLCELADLDNLSIQYYRGWDKERALHEVLNSGLARDAQTGYTHAGPQRADLRIRMGKGSAVDILSRGQLKLVVCALKLAQGFLYKELQNKQCLFLVDDLPSELDIPNRQKLCRLFQKMNCQTFITCVEKEALANCWLPETEVKMFHVKHGQITLDDNPGQQSIRRAESLEIEHE
ncbi:DNA replication/repair protein RecF [Endozoicomonas sp. SCSIO W0465]|uniref:DNA replication/repair protein RecF n=1 Tax=Endozoicomonas sp. SCSIO W0465 TaxID=2918516 RepID=UPI0020751877|nr:DNA replication/repair protein RecF [Endozoicomonas sp. SCSIO W0465]USE36674.1 DNA replication/repair protein RecF [Endozoicomonas sp. SCSIO W0465]